MKDVIIDFMKYFNKKQKIHKKEKKEITIEHLKEFCEQLDQSKEEIERISSLFSFAKYSLFFNCLFHNNHNTNHDIKVGFLIGFKEEHLDEIEETVCNLLKKLDRPYRIVNARGKSFLKFAEELTDSYFDSSQRAHYEIDRQFNSSNKVFIIREFSGAKVDSKGYYLRDFIKIREKVNFIDSDYFEKVRPDSDLVFLDY
ncbi:MAG: hypothetical protein FJ134_03670, partial [Deltaproteobacteria bacterium]|nr:hypothetical protein [Deltaproteobacteria bacterium]